MVLERTHVHGLGFDPDGHLLLATHNGLFAVDPVTLNAARRGTSGDNFMGFRQVSGRPGTARASGHPAPGGNLGVIGTTDGGATWRPLSPGVSGPVDFHQMEVSRADPAVVWGIHHGALLQISRDGGKSWSATGRVPEGLIDIATSPADVARLFAATRTGLLTSPDGGTTWEALIEGHPVTLVDAVPDGRILAFVPGRGLLAAPETGAEQEWKVLGPGPSGDYLLQMTRDPGNPDRLYAPTGENHLVVSRDGGRSWSLVARP